MSSTATRRSNPVAAIIISVVAALGGLTACGEPASSTVTAIDAVAPRPDADGLLADGLDQLERARITRDERDYLVADELLDEAARLAPDDLDALIASASVAAARHRFPEAIDIATGVLFADPERVDALAIRGDAFLAIGDAVAAARDHALLHQLAPGPASLVRLAQGLEESGDPWTARELVTAALRDVEADERAGGATPSGEAAAWFRWRVGDLNRHLGDLDAAAQFFAEAAAIVPGYALAMEGLADVALQRGDVDGAATLVDGWAGDTVLRLETELAIATATGDAERIDELHTEIIARLEPRDPVASGLDLAAALLAADTRLDEALRLTTDEVTRRTDGGTLAVHAQALLANGRSAAALDVVEQFLATGTNEPDRLVTAAAVYVANGDPSAALVQLRRAFDVGADPAVISLIAELDQSGAATAPNQTATT